MNLQEHFEYFVLVLVQYTAVQIVKNRSTVTNYLRPLSRVWHPGPGNSRSREFFNFFDGIGTGLEKIWYRKKSRNRSRKNLVPKKVPEPVSKKFSTEKSLTTGIKKIYMYFRLQRSPCELNNASHHRMPGLHQKSLPGNAVTLLFLV